MARSRVWVRSAFAGLHLQRAGELQEAGDQRIGAVHFSGDEAAISRATSFSALDVARQHFGRRLDGAQRIAQFVRQAGGKLPQRGQAVGAAHRLLCLLELGIGVRQFQFAVCWCLL